MTASGYHHLYPKVPFDLTQQQQSYRKLGRCTAALLEAALMMLTACPFHSQTNCVTDLPTLVILFGMTQLEQKRCSYVNDVAHRSMVILPATRHAIPPNSRVFDAG